MNDLVTIEAKPRAELAQEAMDYRRQGASYASIAEEMHLTVPDVIALVQEAVLSSSIDLDPQTTQRLDIERLELMMAGCFQAASSGDIESINTVTRLMVERQKIEAKRPPKITDLFK